MSVNGIGNFSFNSNKSVDLSSVQGTSKMGALLSMNVGGVSLPGFDKPMPTQYDRTFKDCETGLAAFTQDYDAIAANGESWLLKHFV